MSAALTEPRFHEARREGVPTDVGLFWEPDAEELVSRLQGLEADRGAWIERYGTMDELHLIVARERDALTARVEEVWTDRDNWIERYAAMDALHHALARERDALRVECEGMRSAVVQARELRAGEQHRLAEERAAADMVRATLTIERDSLLAQYAALEQHTAAIEADRILVEQHRDALAADREVQIAARADAEVALAAPRRVNRVRQALGKLRRAARRIFAA